MDAIVSAVRRFFNRHGEGLLLAATKELDKVVEKLEGAVARISDEISREYQAISDERIKFAAREAESKAAISALSTSYDRAKRVSRRIAGLVE